MFYFFAAPLSELIVEITLRFAWVHSCANFSLIFGSRKPQKRPKPPFKVAGITALRAIRWQRTICENPSATVGFGGLR